MKTIGEINKETERQNLSFSEICSRVTDFEGFEFLQKPFCTLLKKISDNLYCISFDASVTDIDSMSNGLCMVTIGEDYIYDVETMKGNRVIEY